MLGVEHAVEPEKLNSQALLKNSDLFDAEDSSDSESAPSPVRQPSQQTKTRALVFSDDSDDSDSDGADLHITRRSDGSDEEEEENQVRNGSDSDGEERTSPKPDASKRKTKTPREKKPRRQKRSEVTDIHSESQRIVRESSVRLPYHKPARKTIDDFFKKKPSTAQSTGLFLKPIPLKGAKKLLNGSTAAKHSTINSSQLSKPHSNNKLKLSVNTQVTNNNKDDSATEDDDKSSLKLPGSPMEDFPIVENWLKNIQPPKTDDGVKDSANGELDGGEKLPGDEVGDEDTEEDSLHLTGILSSQEDEDDEEEGQGCMNTGTKNIVDSDKEKCVQPDDVDVKTAAETIQSDAKKTSATVSNKDVAVDSTVEEDFTTMDIDQLIDGTISKEQSTKEMDKDADVDNHKLHESVNKDSAQTPVLAANPPISQTQEVSTPVPVEPQSQPASNPSSAFKTPHQQVAKTKRQLLLEASMEKLKAFTPRLQGSPEAVIDLEGSGDEAPVLNPGVDKLKHRFQMHSKKRAARKKRQVEVSIVSKEVDKDGKEELKLDKVLTTIDADEEDVDPALQVPGARLLLLKDTLQAKMKKKREELRQAREAAYRLDNELGEEDEEEAKADADLTDQTDTDYDPEEDNLKDSDGPGDVEEDEDEVEEEMDEEDYEEEPVRRKFEFGDEEADVDEDADDEEDYEDEEDEDEETRRKKRQDDETETGAMASGEDSDEDDEEMGRRKVTPTRLKTRKKRQLLLDDEDDDEEVEEKMVLEISADEPELKTSKNVLKDPLNEPSENSRLSAASSARALSHVTTKSSSVSIGFTLDGSKTMEMFDSNTNMTSNGDTTENNKAATDVSATDGESVGFAWSALTAQKEKDEMMKENESLELKLDSSTHSNGLDTSFDMFGSIIPAHQPGGGMKNKEKSANDSQFTPFSKQKSLLSSVPRSTSKLSELTMPVEDSQDLFRNESPLPSLALSDSQRESQSFHFSFEDETQSQFLDENGFINVRPSIAKPKPSAKKLFSGETNCTQGNMSELLGLCSGQFSEGTQGVPRSSSPKRTFGGTGPFSQITKGLGESQGGDMDELLQLCSGTFAKTQAQQNVTAKEKQDDDADSEASFHLVSDNEGFRSDDNKDEENNKFKGLSSDEDNDDGETKKKLKGDGEAKSKKRRRIRMVGSSDEEGDDGLVTSLKPQKKSKGFSFPKKKQPKMLKNDFADVEAELSGDEFDSDENYDAEEFGDDLEIEAGDQEEIGDEEELRDQVNRVHMKAIDDDDARRLRIYKEMLLPDGDLHSDNKGRQRQFKWRNQNNYEDSQTDMFNDNSDGEGLDENDEDTQWRMKRFEREQWLLENKQKHPDKKVESDDEENIVPAEEENSQFVKFMKKAVLQKPKRAKAPVAQSTSDSTSGQQAAKDQKALSPKKFIKPSLKSHGSFLHRKKDVAKIAATKAVNNPNTSGMARQFVFQTMSPPKQEEDQIPPKVKRSNSVTGSMAPPKAKRPRLERSQSTASQNSIFSHL